MARLIVERIAAFTELWVKQCEDNENTASEEYTN